MLSRDIKVVNELLKENATSKHIRNVVYVYDPVECFMVIVLRKTQGIRSLAVWRLTFVKIIYAN